MALGRFFFFLVGLGCSRWYRALGFFLQLLALLFRFLHFLGRVFSLAVRALVWVQRRCGHMGGGPVFLMAPDHVFLNERRFQRANEFSCFGDLRQSGSNIFAPWMASRAVLCLAGG